jgi:tetratricopeptide (TPR) repeat protein
MRLLSTRLATPLLPVLALSLGCRGAAVESDTPPGPDAGADTALAGMEDEPGAPAQDDDERAIDAIRAGDHAAAHAILSEVLVRQEVARARAFLADDSPEDSLLCTDRALALAPRDPEARLLAARGHLRLAEKSMSSGAGALFVEGGLRDALAAYRAAGSSAEALFGASRAAWLLRENDDALRFARSGMAALDEEPSAAEALSFVPERVLSQAAFGAYVTARGRGEEAGAADEARVLFAETEDALSRLLGRDGTDPWCWSTLSDLYEWEGMLADARATLERGLDRVPDDDGLLDRLVRVARKAGGRAAVIEATTAFRERHPSVARGVWYQSVERFELALDELLAQRPDAEAFRVAEAGLVACRELEPSFADSCRSYEVMCRAGAGWSLYNASDLTGARDAFLSMNEVIDQGIEWQIEGRLLSGILGLQFIGGEYNRLGDWARAADTFELLRGFQPGESAWANNAGFFHRDAAVQLEIRGRRFCRAARGEITDAEALAGLRTAAGVDDARAGTEAERAAFVRAANEAAAAARATMERSAAAYRDAAALAPTDVRIVNDTALVLVYYLHTDLDFAEELLLRCVEMAREQLSVDSLEEDARWELQNAWGDAHQNLGVLHASLTNDFEAATTWFEKCVEIGPEPRPVVTQRWLPFLRGELDASAHDELLATITWAQPCETNDDDK